MRARFLVLLATLVLASPASAGSYLFTYFIGNGEDGLHLAWSDDAFHWQALNGGRSCLAPQIGQDHLMRDPCLASGPDGVYQLVWTSGWWERAIGHASSRDLVHWSAQQEIPVMAAEPTARNSWAPELFWDEGRNEWLIFWASTIPGRFPDSTGASENQLNHRIYCTTTKDFVAFAPTRLLLDPGFNAIDATFLRFQHRLWLVVKDETKLPVAKKNLRLVAAETPQGPFGPASEPFSPAGLWVEGPTALQVGEDVLVFFDAYHARHYGALRSRDLKAWEDVTARMSFPGEGTAQRMRHGTALAIPPELLAALKAALP